MACELVYIATLFYVFLCRFCCCYCCHEVWLVQLCSVVLGDTFLVLFLFCFVLYFCLGFQSKHYLFSGVLSRPLKRLSKPCSLISWTSRRSCTSRNKILWGIFKQKKVHILDVTIFYWRESKTMSGYQPKTVPDVQVLEDKYECPTCVRGSSKMDEQVLNTEVWWDSDWV